MGGAGTLTVRTRARRRLRRWSRSATPAPACPTEIQDRIFEPFFTTKPVGEGTGLGLDISWRIVVNKHHGDLRVDSAPGDTRFRVRLPARAGPQTARDRHETDIDPTVPPSGTGCVECDAAGGWWFHLRRCAAVRARRLLRLLARRSTPPRTRRRPATRSSRASSPARTGSATTRPTTCVDGPTLAAAAAITRSSSRRPGLADACPRTGWGTCTADGSRGSVRGSLRSAAYSGLGPPRACRLIRRLSLALSSSRSRTSAMPARLRPASSSVSDPAQPVEVVVAVAAGAALGAVRLEQAAALVEPQVLHAGAGQLGGHRDPVHAARAGRVRRPSSALPLSFGR